MKRYESIGELLVDYRDFYGMSQTEFADLISVDTRTVQRWEKGVTLIKGEKEEEIVTKTMLPYQLVRNLNSTVGIPTYFDFSIRKYSLFEVTNDMPDASWFKTDLDKVSENVRSIDLELDLKYLLNFLGSQREMPLNIVEAIKKAVSYLPKLNLIITDDSGYYSGCSIIFPIKYETYLKLKNKEISENELSRHDIVHHENQEKCIFYNFVLIADNNFSYYYLVKSFFKFFVEINDKDYLYCNYATRMDSVRLNEELGLNIAWEEEPIQLKNKTTIYPRFYEGDFKEFLKDKV